MKWKIAINERSNPNIFQYVKSLKIHNLVKGLLSFLKNIARKTKNINKKEGISDSSSVISSGKRYFRSNILGRKRKMKNKKTRVENCIIQCILSIFCFFIKTTSFR